MEVEPQMSWVEYAVESDVEDVEQKLGHSASSLTLPIGILRPSAQPLGELNGCVIL